MAKHIIQVKNGDLVKLKTFLGTLNPRGKISPWDNYWQLIGESGKIIDDRLRNNRVLVLFDKDLDQFNVANHNEIPNSLWIKPSDLKISE